MSEQKTAMVTGGAVRIGAEIVSALHGRGCKVIVHCNSSAERGQQLVDRLNRDREASAALVCGDLSGTASIESVILQARDAISSWGGGLNVLVNNASRFYPTRVGDTRLFQWQDLIDSNLRAPYLLISGLLGELRTAGGSVVNITDIHADRPMPGFGVYSISKAGLAMLTRAMALELSPDVRVNGVAPGAILWPEAEIGEDRKADIVSRTALGRRGEPADIASAVAYLGLDATFVTGQVLAVDGGRSLHI